MPVVFVGLLKLPVPFQNLPPAPDFRFYDAGKASFYRLIEIIPFAQSVARPQIVSEKPSDNRVYIFGIEGHRHRIPLIKIFILRRRTERNCEAVLRFLQHFTGKNRAFLQNLKNIFQILLIPREKIPVEKIPAQPRQPERPITPHGAPVCRSRLSPDISVVKACRSPASEQITGSLLSRNRHLLA